MSIRIIDKLQEFVRNNATAMDRSLNRMAVDIERLAKFTVPVDKGQLKASGKHRKRGYMRYAVEFNKEYAAFQEFGGDGKRVVKNYTTPGTGKHFLKNAGDSVTANVLDYFKAEARKVRV